MYNSLSDDAKAAASDIAEIEDAVGEEAQQMAGIGGDRTALMLAGVNSDGASYGTVSDLTAKEQDDWDETDWSTAVHMAIHAD